MAGDRRGIILKTDEEIDAMARSGEIIGELHGAIPEILRPGTTTAAIDRWVETFIRDHDGAIPAFKGLYGFPGAACISVNEEVVHGIPSAKRVLREGDLVSVDVGVRLDGWNSDSAWTFPVGEIDDLSRRLLEATEASLWAAIDAARPGGRMGDVGAAVEETIAPYGFHVIRELVGHGIGRDVHEAPQVPNIGKRGTGVALREGLVLAIEPMVGVGTHRIRTLADQWTVIMEDRSRAAHFEHTVALVGEGVRILTAAPGESPEVEELAGAVS